MERTGRLILYLLLTLLIESGICWFTLEMDRDFLPGYSADWIFHVYFAFNVLALPLVLLSVSRRDSPVIEDLRNRPQSTLHLAAFRYPVGAFLGLGFSIPAVIAAPLKAGAWYALGFTFVPVGIVFLAAVVWPARTRPYIDRLYEWTWHWTGRIFISIWVIVYLLLTLSVMVILRHTTEEIAVTAACFFFAYLPLRVYLHYYGHGTFGGLAMIAAGMVFQQVVVWTDWL